jgi:hypothetical protein
MLSLVHFLFAFAAIAEWFPHSVSALPSHLSPLRRERKGARIGELAPFLSPVDRGRGVERSSTEWGSIGRQD